MYRRKGDSPFLLLIQIIFLKVLKMLKAKKRLIIDVAVFMAVIVGISFYTNDIWMEEFNEIKIAHCDNINADVTRPEERKCVEVIDVGANTIKFKTKNGKYEQYLVQEFERKYIYVFEDYIEQEDK